MTFDILILNFRKRATIQTKEILVVYCDTLVEISKLVAGNIAFEQ